MDQQSAQQLNRFEPASGPLSIVRRLLTLSVFIFPAFELQANTSIELPVEHTASYEIEKYGTHIGTMRNSLKLKDGQAYYESLTTAVGFAALLVDYDLQETSILTWLNEQPQEMLRQHSFRSYQGNKNKKNQTISFQWLAPDKALIKGQYKHKNYQLDASQSVWSRQMLPLLISSDLSKDQHLKKRHYVITDHGQLQHYQYEFIKKDSLEIDEDIYSALKFKLSKPDSDRVSYLWFSPDHYFLPIKIEQYKKNSLHLSMLLSNFSLTDNLSAHTEVEDDD